VQIIGLQYDVSPYIAAFDIFVLPSLVEGFPHVLVEAMQMGRPCVVTQVSGATEAIVHNQSGLIVERANESALASALEIMLRCPSQRLAFGVAAKKTATERYGMAARVGRFDVLYRSLAHRGTERGCGHL
jgi:glycosyltransferase involved in cell wall biosynthesis